MLFVVWLFVAPRTVACQTPLSMGFFRQEYRYSLKVTALSVTLSWIIQAEASATQAEMAEKLAQQVGNLKGWDVCDVWGNSLEKERKNRSKGGSQESQGTLVSQGPPSPTDPHCVWNRKGETFSQLTASAWVTRSPELSPKATGHAGCQAEGQSPITTPQEHKHPRSLPSCHYLQPCRTESTSALQINMGEGEGGGAQSPISFFFFSF